MFTHRALLAFVVACGGGSTAGAYGQITIARNGGGYGILALFTDSPRNTDYTVSTVAHVRSSCEHPDPRPGRT